ncbi:hypothetical protein BKA65DRAFT_479133 [Rhexocercosporidium sp. MPI-PUGE-AT-0058]|nr:hypothetical protein BKA65DRAFT_479133 [Rhexocercosporidium sp. MPI-PUGE-AT-0058]
MIHIDHSLLTQNPPPLPPEPALPILACHLLELEEKQRRRFVGNGRVERLSTGCAEVDEVLGGGGVERGVVLGISASVEGREGRLLSLNLLASALLPNIQTLTKSNSIPSSPPKTKATIIDTTGSFPLALLASVLKSRLLEAQSLFAQNSIKTGNYAVQTPEVREDENGREGEKLNVDGQVQKCLEMVAISRVFDVEGLWEVIGELDQIPPVSSDHGIHDESEEKRQKEAVGGPDEIEVVFEQDIGSDEPDPEILDSEEDLTPPTGSLPFISKDQKEETSEDEGTEIIIVDNITHIVNELFARKEKNDAHTLLTLLSQTLHTLTRTHNILTILHNTINPSSSSTSHPPQNPQNPHAHTHRQNPNQNPKILHATIPHSIFASSAQKPALGQIFAQFPDVHLFLHGLPRGRKDAEVLYGREEDGFREGSDTKGGEGGVRYVTVVEVLKDEAPILGEDALGGDGRKFGYREQRWTAVDVDTVNGGTGIVCAFQERGGMRGLGLSRERGAGISMEGGLSGGVGNVAKIWGFGGRRV